MHATVRSCRLVSLAVLPALGCAAGATDVTVEQLEHARPIAAERHWELRVPSGEALTNNITRRLCPEFSLLEIQTPDDLKAFCDEIGLRLPPESIDFRNGMLVGVVANVGESTGRKWPVAIDTIRLRDGAGLIKARFHPGV